MKLSKYQQGNKKLPNQRKERQEPMKDAFALYTYVKLWIFKLIVELH